MKSSMIWTPDLVIMDSAEDKMTRGSHSDKYMAIVSSSGKIRWHYQMLSKSFCRIDPYNFPFDEQLCEIRIRSWAHDKNMLRIKKRNLKVKIKENIQTGSFKFATRNDKIIKYKLF
jgi:nicotinic acetylcholine receptor